MRISRKTLCMRETGEYLENTLYEGNRTITRIKTLYEGNRRINKKKTLCLRETGEYIEKHSV